MASKLNDVITSPALPSANDKKLSKVYQREQWSSKLDFILSCVGYAIGTF